MAAGAGVRMVPKTRRRCNVIARWITRPFRERFFGQRRDRHEILRTPRENARRKPKREIVRLFIARAAQHLAIVFRAPLSLGTPDTRPRRRQSEILSELPFRLFPVMWLSGRENPIAAYEYYSFIARANKNWFVEKTRRSWRTCLNCSNSIRTSSPSDVIRFFKL